MTADASDLVPSSVWRVGCVLVGLALGVSACTTAEDASPSAAPPAPVLLGTVEFPRTLQADRWVEVQLSGAVGDDWVVTQATLRSDYFTEVAPVDQNKRLIEGYTARVRVPLGAASCPGDSAGASIALTMERAGDAPSTMVVALPTDVLAGINAAECTVQAVTDVAGPALGEPTSAEGAVVTTTLTLARGAANGASPVTLVDMTGSVIFDLAPTDSADLPVALAATAESVSIPVVLEATRCDPHAFSESKKTFVFGVWISVGAKESTYVELRPGDELRAALQAALEACR